MKPCQSAGAPCPNEATLVARIAGVGDRPLCRPCFDGYVALSMDIRELEPVLPAWRRSDLARDFTGRIRSAA